MNPIQSHQRPSPPPLASYSNSTSRYTPHRFLPRLRPWLSQNRQRRVIPDNRATNRSRNSHYAGDAEPDPERDFQRSFDRFVYRYRANLAILLYFFFLLLLFTQIFKNNFTTAVYCYMAAYGVYTGYLIHEQAKTKTRGSKGRLGYQILESIFIILFLITIKDGNLDDFKAKVFFIILSVLLLGSYIKQLITAYLYNFSGLVKFSNDINWTVFLMRVLILFQGIFALVQLSLKNAMSWFVTFIPAWMINGLILFFALRLIQIILFRFRLLFWKTDAEKKKKGAFWIFGNLFGLMGLSLWGLITLSFASDERKTSTVSFLGLLIVMIFFCALSLLYSKFLKDEIFEFCQELATIFNTDAKIINDMNRLLEETRNKEIEKKNKEEEEKIRYVIKISSSYFKPATEKDIKKFKSNKSLPTVSSIDMEAEPFKHSNTLGDNANCLVCFGNPPDTVLMECGHGGICYECAQEINKGNQECHMCRQKIKSLVKINVKNKKKGFFNIVDEIQNKKSGGPQEA